MAVRPVLILTKRRTGGTSVATFLHRALSGRMEFEPFNTKKPLGAAAAQQTGGALAALIDQALQNEPHLKHCFDNVGEAVTSAVIRAAVARDYRVLVLTRRDNAKRVMSLAVAESTGAWDSDTAARLYPRIRAGELTPKPIEPDQIRTLVRNDMRRTGRVLTQLRHLGVAYDWMLHEDLFQSSGPDLARARQLAAWAGRDLSGDDPALAVLARDRHQNSAAIGDCIPGYDRARSLAQTLCED